MNTENIDFEKLRHRKVFIGVARHFSSSDVIFERSLTGLAVRPLMKMQIDWSCDPSVERARNILTANFLATDCTHILFIDSDIGFAPQDVARIASHDEPVVGGLYALKNTAPEVKWCVNGLTDAPTQSRPDGLLPVKYVGTGFLCIARQVFEKLIAQDAGVLEYRQDLPPHRLEHAFWRQGVAAGRFLTEDWMFCQRWLELGGQIYADSQVVLRHAGRAEWPLPFQTGVVFDTPKI